MLRSFIVPALAGSFVITSAAVASPVFVGFIDVKDSYGSTGGGEFRATGIGGWAANASSTGTDFQGGISPAAGMFETFCLEKYETTDFGITNFKADINTETVAQASQYAGGNHGGFNDPLDARTAYLYSNFLGQTLTSGYDYLNEANRIEDSNALQQAIWFIEEEDAAPLTGKALAFFNEADAAVTGGFWVGLGNVRVLNVYTNTARTDWQDMLIQIPLPTGAALAGVGLAGVALTRRRNGR